jgi:hypothetical protein
VLPVDPEYPPLLKSSEAVKVAPAAGEMTIPTARVATTNAPRTRLMT